MAQQHSHFPLTTAQQRRLLFTTCEATGDVALAGRTARQALREQLSNRTVVTAWRAILVITATGTRQWLGLPVFVAGATVTAAMVVAVARAMLPAVVPFLISDRGGHVTAQVVPPLATEPGCIQGVIARHRPPSNGLAERFVRTLKEWLADQIWSTNQELAALVAQFRAADTDRPHQGIAIPGVSPNAFAERIWRMERRLSAACIQSVSD